MTKHRWSDKTVFPHKTERECANGCGIVKVGRHETEGGRDRYWSEFWRDGERIEGNGTPPCTGRARAVAFACESVGVSRLRSCWRRW